MNKEREAHCEACAGEGEKDPCRGVQVGMSNAEFEEMLKALKNDGCGLTWGQIQIIKKVV